MKKMTYLKNFLPKVTIRIFSGIGDLTDFLPLKICLWIKNVMDFFTFSEAVEKTDEGDVNIWEDNWDDDAVEDDFSVQLR